MLKFDEKTSNKTPQPHQSLDSSAPTQNSQPKIDTAVDNSPGMALGKISSAEFSGVYADQQEETYEEQMMSAAKKMIEEKASDLITELLQSSVLNLESLSSQVQRCILRRNLLANHRNFSYLPTQFREFFLFTKRHAPVDCEKTRATLQGTLKSFLKHIDLIDGLIETNYMHIIVEKSKIVSTTNKKAFKSSLNNLLNNRDLSVANCQEVSHWYTTANLDLTFLKELNKVLIQNCQEKSLDTVRRMNAKLHQIAKLKSYCRDSDADMVVWVKFWKKDKKLTIQEVVTRMLDLKTKEQTINKKLQRLNDEYHGMSKVRIP